MEDKCPVTDWLSDFDVYDTEYNKDPAPIWAEMHEKCPIPHSERWGGLWMSTKYEDARDLVKMTDQLSNRVVTIAPMKEGTDLTSDRLSHQSPPITYDPPVHTDLRRMILPFFSPKAVETHRPATQALCNQLIDGFIDKGECDAAVDYAQQITPRVIGHMLGIDVNRSDEFVGWVRGFIELGFGDIELREKSLNQMMDFFHEMIAERRDNPGEDYISQLLLKEHEGKPLTDSMVVKYCVLLLIAGIDTTWSSIGSSLYHFASHPEDRRRMVSEPDLFPMAIEEMLRFYAPVSVGRVAMEDTEYKGMEIKRGERLMISFPAANRDPDVFDRADEVVLDREKNRHFAFGIGVHRCAGSNLARMEMDVALRTWFERIPEFELSDPDAVTWAPGQVRGARNVPVRF